MLLETIVDVFDNGEEPFAVILKLILHTSKCFLVLHLGYEPH